MALPDLDVKWRFPVSISTGAVAAIELDWNESIFVAKGVLVASSTSYAIYGAGESHHAIIAGTAASYSTVSTIRLGLADSVGKGYRVTVEAGGEVRNFRGTAVELIGSQTQLANGGLIYGEQTAISLYGISSTTATTVVNSGMVVSRGTGIGRSPLSTETIVFTNSGTLSASIAYDASASGARDLITNTGRISGSIDLGGGNDVYSGASGRLTGRVIGGAGADTIVGGIDNDWFEGGAGNDVLTGNGGNDRLIGGTGADQMRGGLGNDIFFVDNAGDKAFEAAGQGFDTVLTSVSFALAAGQHIESLGTSSATGTGTIHLAGNELAQRINGNNGNNALSGLAGNDVLMGNGGNDWLKGGLGNDTLTGGAGADNFVFDTTLNPSTNVDRITDFNAAADTIRLDNAVMPGLGATLGTLAAAKFWKSTAGVAHDANDRIIYETDTGKLFYDANGSAAGGGVHFATLAPNLVLTNADFVVI